MELKDLDLSEADFILIVKALDYLPESGFAGEMITELMGALLVKDPNQRARLQAEIKHKSRGKDAEKEILKEDCRILQGKLLMFKRYLMQTHALKQANDILNKK